MKLPSPVLGQAFGLAFSLGLAFVGSEAFTRDVGTAPGPISHPTASSRPAVIGQAGLDDFRPPQPQGRAGLGSDSYLLTVTHYTGDCPGDVIGTLNNISFRSETMPPAPFQRVRITNIRTGGYTDREYDERRVRSEPFSLGWLASHSGRFLSLERGSNTLEYVISNRQTGKGEKGQFTIQLDVREQNQTRDFRTVEQLKYCEGERDKAYGKTNIYDCREGYHYNEKVGVCPDGSKQKLSRRKVFNY